MRFFSSTTALALLAVLFVIAGLVGGQGFAIDRFAVDAFTAVRQEIPLFTSALLVFTRLGGGYAAIGLGLAGTAWLLLIGRKHFAILLAAIVFGQRLVINALKVLVDRTRPEFETYPVVTYSSAFPSGHAANSLAIFVAIALTAVPAAWRRPAVIIALLTSLLLGLSRVALGVHWPTDVVGGWLLGLMTIWLAIRICDRSRPLQIEAQDDVVRRHG